MIETKNIEKILAEQGSVISPIKGDSMFPMLDEEKDAVRIVPVRGVLKKYDIPLYRRPGGQLVLHRIIEVRKNHYMICGDNRDGLEKVPFRWVVGVVEGFFKDGKYIPVTDEEYTKYVIDRCKSIKNRDIIVKYAPSDKKLPFIKRAFPEYYTMVRLYPSLEKVPVLLPAAWVARLAKIAFTRGKK